MFIEKETWHRCFHVNFVKCLRRSFLQNTSGILLFRLENMNSEKIEEFEELKVECTENLSSY